MGEKNPPTDGNLEFTVRPTPKRDPSGIGDFIEGLQGTHHGNYDAVPHYPSEDRYKPDKGGCWIGAQALYQVDIMYSQLPGYREYFTLFFFVF